MLNTRQLRFCEEYVIDLSGTRAAIRAGYSKKTAAEHASRLLTDVRVKAKIAELQAEIAERNRLKADDVINELRKIAFWNIRDFVGKDNTIKSIHSLNKELSTAITGIKVKESKTKIGEEVVHETTTELKMADKLNALVNLGRHLGVFKEDNNQRAAVIKVTRK